MYQYKTTQGNMADDGKVDESYALMSHRLIH